MARFAKYQLDFTDPSGVVYNFFFLAPPDHYEDIENATGVSALAADSPLLDMPITKTEELSISPVAYRKTLRVTDTATGRSKYVDILIAAEKVLTAQTDLFGATYKGGKITRVFESRKQTTY